MRVRRWIVAGLTVAVGAASLLAEAVLRVRERRLDAPGTLGLALYQHRRLGVALVRQVDYFGRFHVDANGFRGGPVAPAPPAHTLRIIALGGSTTFDASVAGDENAWPARLEHWLRQLAPGLAVEVINAGVPGYTILDDLIRLQAELHAYSPDIIVLYQAHNDLATAVWRGTRDAPKTRRPDEVRPLTPWRRWLAAHSLLYHKLRARWSRLFPGDRGGWTDGAAGDTSRLRRAIADGATQFGRDLGSFLAIAREFGICVVLPETHHVSGVGTLEEHDPAALRAWHRTLSGTPPGIALEAYERYRQVLHAVAGRGGAAVVPGAPFELRGPQYFAREDPIHFSSAGADRMGRFLAEALVDSGVLDAGAWCEHRTRVSR